MLMGWTHGFITILTVSKEAAQAQDIRMIQKLLGDDR